MKRQFSRLLLAGALVSPLASCSSDDGPAPAPVYRISWISSDDSYQLFDYDAEGRVSLWRYGDPALDASAAILSTFEYPVGEDVILITSREQRGPDIWSFTEKLRLAPDGTASHASGTVTITRNDGSRLMMKNYTADFHYDSSDRLNAIDIVEKRTDDSGWEESDGLKWTVALQWKDDNLVKYSEYSHPDHPFITKTLTYFGGEAAHYSPIVQGTVLRYYYLPLQYQGVLGRRSAGLVSEMAIASCHLNYSLTFSYDISASIHSSAVEGYTQSMEGEETKYTVGWDTCD